MKNISVGYVCIVAGLIFSLMDRAQGQDYNRLRFEHITHQQGLSQSTGKDILQDYQGFIWFATNDGLNRYDGYDIKVFREHVSDSTSISGNDINVLFEDSNNNLWIGTNGSGLNLYNRDRGTFTHFVVNHRNYENEGISDDTITDILEDEQGRLWIGTHIGLNIFYPKEKRFVRYYSDSYFKDSTNTRTLSDSYITALEKGKNGHIWVGTQEGLNRWSPQTKDFTRFLHDPSDPHSLSENHIRDLVIDDRGTLWIGTSGGGLNYYDEEKKQFHHFRHVEDDPGSISGNNIYSLFVDSRGVLWVGTELNGLNIFNHKTKDFRRYNQESGDEKSLSTNAIFSIYESRDQTIWIGTFAGGINYTNLKPPRFEHYYRDAPGEKKLSNNRIRAFLEDSYGNFWVGTDGGGLNRFDLKSKTFETFKHEKGNSHSPVTNGILALHEDSDRNIWIAYYNGGISKFNPETGRYVHFRHNENDSLSISTDDIYVIHEDTKGRMWFGANNGGINLLNPENNSFKTYLYPDAVRDIQNAESGALWVGAYGTGLTHLDPRTGKSYNYITYNSEMPDNNVLVIHEDKEGILWLGTLKGLVRFDPKTEQFASYNTRDGLPNNVVKGILEDDQGNLWISTNNGLSKFNKKTETFTNYGPEDGLQSKEFNSLAYYKDSEGYMYFGGVHGFNRFHPENVKLNQSVVPVKITDFQIFNQPVEVGENSPLKKQITQASEIRLPNTASVITFKFAALSYQTINYNEYAYMLEGFDQDWNYVGDKRTATYTNLAPGEYTFRVRASNNDGVWSEKGAELAVTVTPPFWQTYAFYLITGTFTGVFLLVIYQWKVLSVRRRNEELEQMVADRTSELHGKNRKLEEALQNLKTARNALYEQAHKAGMADIATGVLHNVGNILNSVNTSASVTGDILKKTKLNGFFKANKLLKENEDNLDTFLTSDPRGKKLMTYYLKLEGPLQNELKLLEKHNNRLEKKIELINNVISAQQKYANTGLEEEDVAFDEIIDYVLNFYTSSFERHNIQVEKKLEYAEPVKIQKTKLIHILINLFKNAKESLVQSGQEQKKIIVRLYQNQGKIHLAITDNGLGIARENLTRVFNHGFTTKDDGHGFGLHSCANYMKEMNGKIEVDSEGPGKGATFTLSFVRKSSAPHSSKQENKNSKLRFSEKAESTQGD